jgi:hypothetical protein
MVASALESLRLIAEDPKEDENFWRREFEYAGYGAVKRIATGLNGWDEPRREYAARWLEEKEQEVATREKQMRLDTARVDKNIEQIEKEVGGLWQEVTRLREGTEQIQRDARQMLWASLAAIVTAAIVLCVSVGYLMDRTKLINSADKASVELAQSAPLTHPAPDASDSSKLDQRRQDDRSFRRTGRRYVDRNPPP